MTTKPTSLSPGATPTLGMPAAPPLPAELETLARGLRLPHLRRAAPEVLATARAQRWEPAEVLKALLAAEAAGRARSSRATRRAAAEFPTGKTAARGTPPAPRRNCGLVRACFRQRGIPLPCSLPGRRQWR